MASYGPYRAIWQPSFVISGFLSLAFIFVEIASGILTRSWLGGGEPCERFASRRCARLPAPQLETGKGQSPRRLEQTSRSHRGWCGPLLRRAASGTAAIFARLLNGRTWHISIRAKDAAVSGQRLQPFLAMRALVKEPACVARHGFGRGRFALGASDRGDSLHQAPPSARISGCSIKPHSADRTIMAVAIINTSRVAPLWTGFSQPSALHTRALRK